MDREISKKSNWKKWVAYTIVGALCIYGFFLIRNKMKPTLDSSEVLFATVQKGRMENTISAVGLIKPISEVLITSPLSSRIKKIHMNEGESVQAGSTIMTLDTEFATLEYSKLQDELKMKENNVKRLQLNLKKNLRDIEIDNGIKDLELQGLQAKLKDAQRLLRVGGGTEEEIQQIEQLIAIGNLQKQKLENELNYRKASMASDVKNEQLQSSIQEKVLDELGKKIRLTVVKAPNNGVITWMNTDIGTQVTEGQELVKIAQLNNFNIIGTASDIHAEKINIGLPVRVRINKEVLNGRVEQILPSVKNNTVEFRIQLDKPDSKLLRAHMKVELAVVESSKENTVYLKNTRAYKGGRTQDFYVQNGETLVRRRCNIGITNSQYIEILDGLKVGDQVVINDMTRYEEQDIVPFKTSK